MNENFFAQYEIKKFVPPIKQARNHHIENKEKACCVRFCLCHDYSKMFFSF